MRRPAVLLCMSFFAASSLVAGGDTTAQRYTFPDSTLRVRSVYCIGNDVTKEYIILREMSLKAGALLTYEAIEYDINRIYSLRLFNRVDIQVVSDADSADLAVVVSERWYFYPYPIAGLRDHSWSKIYYGLGLAHTNVGGRNVQFYAQGALGYDPFASLMYSNPLLVRDAEIFFTSRVSYNLTRNKSLVSQGTGANFDEEVVSGEVTLGKRLSLFSSVSTTLSYLQLTVSDNKAGRTLSPDGTDRFPSLSLGYRFDTRDLAEYARRGTLVSVAVSKYGLPGKLVDFQSVGFDVRQFVPVSDYAGIVGRMFGSFSNGGTIPNYSHVYFGYGDKIRGHFKTTVEGEEIVGGKVEVHLPLISPRYIRFEEVPIEQFRTIRYALNVALFADAGNVWYRTEPFAMNRFLSGFGAGLHLLISYSAVVRLEYAWSAQDLSHSELIFDLGAAL
jgi:outer membrane protein assembly factor BamA